MFSTASGPHSSPPGRCAEFTVEAGRPDTITADKLETLKRHGIHRISINPQSMEDQVLRAMGRSHTAGEIVEAMALSRCYRRTPPPALSSPHFQRSRTCTSAGRGSTGRTPPAAEFTVEAGRPDTITADKLETLKKHGIHRISINPQSMEDQVGGAEGYAYIEGHPVPCQPLLHVQRRLGTLHCQRRPGAPSLPSTGERSSPT